MAPEEEETVARAKVQAANKMFDQMVKDRHEYGSLKYGEFTFLSAPTMQMCLEELADWMNYTRYTAVKLILFMEAVEKAQAGQIQKAGGHSGGFVSMRHLLGLEGEE